MQTISPAQARKLALVSQGIYTERELGRGVDATLKAIEKLAYIQIDTISVVERAHHHTLWNRTSDYQLEHLAELQESAQIFEYWSHAAAYLPINDFRYSLPAKRVIRDSKTPWHGSEPKLLKYVLDRITTDGPLRAKDFAQPQRANSQGWWDWKPAKRALEQLFMQGELMVAKRIGFQKVYDLTERVLPSEIDSRHPSDSEYYQHLITRYLSANGIGSAAHCGYLRKGLKAKLKEHCVTLCEDGLLVELNINQQVYYALPEFERLLEQPISQRRVKILSPFDNLLIQRQRTRELFDFNYQIECYVPAAKRQYGYFCLPLLWGDKFAGRMDAKIDRKTGVLHILNLHIESDKPNAFKKALQPALTKFLRFNNGHTIAYS